MSSIGTHIAWLRTNPLRNVLVPASSAYMAYQKAVTQLGVQAHGFEDVGTAEISPVWNPSTRVPSSREQATLEWCRRKGASRPYRLYTGENERPYLLRVGLLGGVRDSGMAPYLHRFVTPDLDPAHHCHPWRVAVSVVLCGGYTEERTTSTGQLVTRKLRSGDVNVLFANTFHRVTELDGETWTLIFLGPRTGKWGFMVDGKYVPSAERLRQRGIGVPFAEAAE